MEILSARPQCLSIEARHTISLEVAKQRRLKVASSLFLPKKNPKTSGGDMGKEVPESNSKAKSKPSKNKKKLTTPQENTPLQGNDFRQLDKGSYDPRQSLSLLGSIPNLQSYYTALNCQEPATQSHDQSVCAAPPSHEVSTQSPTVGSLTEDHNTSQSDACAQNQEPPIEKINQSTCTEPPKLEISTPPLIIIEDDEEADQNLIQQFTEDMLIQTRGTGPAAASAAFPPNVGNFQPEVAVPPSNNPQNQQFTWQISLPTLESAVAPMSINLNTPLASLAAMNNSNPLNSLALLPSQQKVNGTGISLGSGENFMRFAASGEPIPQPNVCSQARGAQVCPETPQQKATQGKEPAKKAPPVRRKQPTKPPTPPEVFQHSYRPLPPQQHPSYGYAKPGVYVFVPPSERDPRPYPSENSFNHGYQEIRYNPYQHVTRPPPIMLPSFEMDHFYPQQQHAPIPGQISQPSLPASLAPADMSRWLSGRYQQAIPQPPRHFVSMDRQLPNYQQAIVRYEAPPAQPNPPNHQSRMGSFYEQYAEATKPRYTHKPPMTNYGLPNMMVPSKVNPMHTPSQHLSSRLVSGQSSSGHPQGLYTPMRTELSHAPAAGQSYYSNVLPSRPPATAERFPSYNEMPMNSHNGQAMGRMTMNEHIPERFYRNMMNMPEYDPRDNR